MSDPAIAQKAPIPSKLSKVKSTSGAPAAKAGASHFATTLIARCGIADSC
jgi:hypothetical protein